MELLKHKIFFHEEFFGSRIYNAKDQKEYFFDKDSTIFIKKILSDNYKNSPSFNKLKNDLIKKELLTSDVVYIKNKKSDSLSFPLRVSLNITKKCNLRCKHCFSDSGDSDSNELTTKELFNLIDQMRSAGTFFLTIGGGEPLLRNDLFRVIKYARKNFIAVSIVTNGLLIHKEIAKKFNELNLKTITIGIDGLEKTHDQVRRKGNFRRAINKIKILRKYCQTATLAMRVTINSLNINEYKELIKLAEKLSLDVIRFTPILLLGRAKDNQDLLISQDKYIHFLENTQDLKSKIELDLPGESRIKINLPGKGMVHQDFGCHCGKEVCWITQIGDFYSCIFFGDNFKVGNIRNESFSDLWVKARNIVKLNGNKTCNSCSEYEKCRGGCRARALSEYKDINAVDPFCALKKHKPQIIKSIRAPHQVLILPFVKEGKKYYYAIFKRKDMNIWQFIAGGGEGNEKPIKTMRREAYEEASINKKSHYIKLASITTIPAVNIHGLIWGKKIIMIPEFAFGVELPSRKLKLSDEHTEHLWLSCEDAIKKLRYDSNKSAVWELDYRLKNKNLNGIEKNRQSIRRFL